MQACAARPCAGSHLRERSGGHAVARGALGSEVAKAAGAANLPLEPTRWAGWAGWPGHLVGIRAGLQTSQQADEISFSSTRTTFQHGNRGWLVGHWQQEHIHLLLHLLCPVPGDRLLQRGRGGAQHLPPFMITLFQQRLAPDSALLPLLEVQRGEKAIRDVS